MTKNYYAWMLRITQSGSEEEKVWRVSLEDPHTRERRGFETLEALYQFLKNPLDSSNHVEDQEGHSSDPKQD